MQNDFVHPEGALYINRETVVSKIEQYITSPSTKYDHVILTMDTHGPYCKEFDRFPPHCIRGNWGWCISPLIGIAVKDKFSETQISHVYKSSFSAAIPLVEIFDNLHHTGKLITINQIDIIGVCTNICVLHTAADLVFRDYNVAVIEDLVDSYNLILHEEAIIHMRDILGIQII